MINSKGTTHCICIAWTVKHRFSNMTPLFQRYHSLYLYCMDSQTYCRFSNMTPLFNLCDRGIRLPSKHIPPSARWHSDAFWGHVITILAWKPAKILTWICSFRTMVSIVYGICLLFKYCQLCRLICFVQYLLLLIEQNYVFTVWRF